MEAHTYEPRPWEGKTEDQEFKVILHYLGEFEATVSYVREKPEGCGGDTD